MKTEEQLKIQRSFFRSLFIVFLLVSIIFCMGMILNYYDLQKEKEKADMYYNEIKYCREELKEQRIEIDTSSLNVGTTEWAKEVFNEGKGQSYALEETGE